jgi:hypothetical protein
VKFYVSVLTVSLALIVLTALPSPAQKKHKEMPIKEYEAFHEVLHPLEHEALPKKDYESIRTKADELVSRGNAIVNLGVPYRMADEKKEPFERELQTFGSHLKAFATNAKEGSDQQLRESFDAVHDSFELLVSMLPQQP